MVVEVDKLADNGIVMLLDMEVDKLSQEVAVMVVEIEVFKGTIEVGENNKSLIINGREITLSCTRDASAIPWAAAGSSQAESKAD